MTADVASLSAYIHIYRRCRLMEDEIWDLGVANDICDTYHNIETLAAIQS